MQVKNEVSPVVVWTVVGVVVVVVVIIGIKMFGGSRKVDTTGSEDTIKKVQQTGKFYEPPPGVVHQSGPSTGPPSGYHFTPPSR
jgi:hypothetical protein